MSDPAANESHLARIVQDVLRETQDERGTCGFVLTGPPGPEGDLIRRWLSEAGLTVHAPRGDAVAAAARTLTTAGVGAPHATEAARRAIAWALARAEALIEVGHETKTHLLLEGCAARVIPLGDLWASQVRELAGGISPLALLVSEPPEMLVEVDRTLGSFLEEGASFAEAAAALPDRVRRGVRRGLRRAAPGSRPPLVPKVSDWTPGLDLAL